MRWNLFRRSETPDVHGSSFESTVADEMTAANTAEPGSSDQAEVARSNAAAAAASAALIVESESIGHVGRYALKTILGKGGLGTVYAAWDPLLSRTVALKTLHIDADPTARESLDALFLNEARAAAGLSHPHIVTVFDAGPSETGVYIAMERLQGQDLRHLLQQGVRPGPIEAAQVVRRIADALAYAHRKGVVHCDVKPANIFMTGRMHPKVLDFGIARVAHRDVPALEGVAAGSPFYLAPEQLEGRSVDRRSDVYSLGVVLYELLAGKRPFEGKSLEEITGNVKNAELVPPHRVSPKVPLGLSVIACHAMERDPDKRYPSARHLSMELRHWLDSTEAGALRDEARGTPPAKSGPSTAVRIARIAIPLFTVAVIAGVWWAKSMLASDSTTPVAGAASAPLQASAPASTPEMLAAAERARAASAAQAASVAAAAEAASAASAAEAEAAASAASATELQLAQAASAAHGDKPMTKAEARAEAARRRKAMGVTAAGDAPSAPAVAAPTEGIVQLAVIPWGQVEVDGKPMGISPPLARLTLSAGPHTITVRNTDFPPYTASLTVSGDNPVTLRHSFGP